MHDFVEKCKNQFVTNRSNQQTSTNVWLNLKNIVFKTLKQDSVSRPKSRTIMRVTTFISKQNTLLFACLNTCINFINIKSKKKKIIRKLQIF